jgi:hypothetical protein
VESSRYSSPLQLGIAAPTWQPNITSDLEVTRIADGKTFEDDRIRVGEDSAVSVWMAGLPADATIADLSIRLNGTDLPAIWLAPSGASRQVNALLPAGVEPGKATLSVVFRGSETRANEVELHK